MKPLQKTGTCTCKFSVIHEAILPSSIPISINCSIAIKKTSQKIGIETMWHLDFQYSFTFCRCYTCGEQEVIQCYISKLEIFAITTKSILFYADLCL